MRPPPISTLFPYTPLSRSLFTNRHVTPPASARHVVEQYLALLEPLGVRPAAIEFPLTRASAAESRGNRNRSEEHTSELQSRPHLVCRLLLEKKKQTCHAHM